MSNITHGLSRHPHYRRWNSFVSRCYNPGDLAYKAYGARGIGVEQCWHPDNPEGVANFLTWVDQQVEKNPQLFEVDPNARFEVMRRDVDKNFSPNNCTIVAEGISAQNRRPGVLTAEEVIALRRRMKSEAGLTLTDLSLKTGHSLANLSRCLRGVTWAAVNDQEPPLGVRYASAALE